MPVLEPPNGARSDDGRYKTAADYAYAQLRSRIVRGELAPGERIDQDAEAARLSVSRMPIREALRRLASESLVDIAPHRGASVRPVSIDDLEDLYVLRLALEGLAGLLGTLAVDEIQLTQMRALIPKMENVVERHDPDAWLELDWTFHSLLYTAAGRPRLVRYIQMLREEASRYRRMSFMYTDELHAGLESHHAILTACDTRDGKEVERIIVRSLEMSREKLRSLLRDRFDH